MRMKRALVALVLLAHVALMVEQSRAQAQLVAPLASNAFRKAISASIAANVATRVGTACTGPCLVAAQLKTMARIDRAANDAVFASSTVMTVAAIAGAPVWGTVLIGLGVLAAVGAVAWGVYSLSQESETTLVLQRPSPATLVEPQEHVSEAKIGGSPIYGRHHSVPDHEVYSFTGRIIGGGSCFAHGEGDCSVIPEEYKSAKWHSVVFPFGRSRDQFDVIGDSVDEAIRNVAVGAMWALVQTLPQGHQATDFRFGFLNKPWCTSIPPPGQVCSQWKFRLAFDYRTPAEPSEWPRVSYSFRTHVMQGGGFTPIAIRGSLEELQMLAPPEMLREPVPDSLIAEVANRLWQRAAAADDFDGLPYEAGNPITQQQVSAALKADPDLQPKWSDLVEPARDDEWPFHRQSPSVPAIPIRPVPRHNEQGQSAPQQQPNSDPGVPPPDLERVPTAAEILEPLLKVYRRLQEFAVPSHSAECPRPQIELFEKLLTLDKHCDLTEKHRIAIHAVMLAVWSMVALFIVLRA